MWPISAVLELVWRLFFIFFSLSLHCSLALGFFGGVRSLQARARKGRLGRRPPLPACALLERRVKMRRRFSNWPRLNPLSAHLSKRPAVVAILRRDAAIDLLFSRSRRHVNGNLIPFNGFYRPPLRALSPQSDKTHGDRA